MDADGALIRAWNLGIDTGWTDAVIDEAERLLPMLIAAGYAEADENRSTWRFTPKGVARADELEDAAGRP